MRGSRDHTPFTPPSEEIVANELSLLPQLLKNLLEGFDKGLLYGRPLVRQSLDQVGGQGLVVISPLGPTRGCVQVDVEPVVSGDGLAAGEEGVAQRRVAQRRLLQCCLAREPLLATEPAAAGRGLRGGGAMETGGRARRFGFPGDGLGGRGVERGQTAHGTTAQN